MTHNLAQLPPEQRDAMDLHRKQCLARHMVRGCRERHCFKGKGDQLITMNSVYKFKWLEKQTPAFAEEMRQLMQQEEQR